MIEHDDVIDSRDIINRIEELEDTIEEIEEALEEAEDEVNISDMKRNLEALKEELEPLKALADEASQYAPDWDYGETLIHDNYFTQYARELVVDCGYISKDFPVGSRSIGKPRPTT